MRTFHVYLLNHKHYVEVRAEALHIVSDGIYFENRIGDRSRVIAQFATGAYQFVVEADTYKLVKIPSEVKSS